jgi:hypothetical protein
MPISFNSILRGHGIEPSDVTMVRHNLKGAAPGERIHEIWRDDPDRFSAYQRVQNTKRRGAFGRPYWAVCVSAPEGTMFIGLYRARYIGLLREDTPAFSGGVDKAGTLDEYDLEPDPRMDEYKGLLFIEWGSQHVRIAQEADRYDKAVTMLRTKDDEPAWPGHLKFVRRLSEIPTLPETWIEILKASRGIYLLSCSDTREQYVGQADGEGGFYQRWMQYVRDGHGGNVRLRHRQRPSDYQVSILQVGGSGERLADLETLWKTKLQTREMGLNGN